jgi:hypothetical protein
MDLEQSRDFRGAPSGGEHAEDFRALRLGADSDEGGHQFQFDRGHHSNLMAARLASSRGPVLFMS